jgi:hypothetical protein
MFLGLEAAWSGNGLIYEPVRNVEQSPEPVTMDNSAALLEVPSHSY